jgi:carboxypeptidase Taq
VILLWSTSNVGTNDPIVQAHDARVQTTYVRTSMTKARKRKPVRRTAKAVVRKDKSQAKPTAKPATKRPSKQNGRSAEALLVELKGRLRETSDLNMAAALLDWDQATYMPEGGAVARGRQGAMLRRLAHEQFVDPALGRLLDALVPHAERLPSDSDDACLIRVARRDFERAIRVPADYVARANALAAASYDAWTKARPANDFATMRPFLEQTLELSREYADFFAPYDHIADPLIDDSDQGMTTATIRALFKELRAALVPMVRAICDQEKPDDRCLRGPFAEAQQLDFGLTIAKRMGYDLARGRLDKTHHPFCTKFALGDVRITTRVREDDLGDALFSTLHEAGHAMYEQGVAPGFEGTPLGRGASSGVHESQSRLWENVVARSVPFWEHTYPELQRTFPDQLGAVPLETFYRAVNKVERSLIRTDADEVTYNLHVMLRFELEVQMLEGRLAIKDLPEAWNAAMRADLGVEPPDDRDGCLQDVHWFSGGIGGGFQSYTIGNILAAQFFAAAVGAHPEIPAEIARGEFATLHGWLRDHLYRHGRKFAPSELVERATGAPMSMAPYLVYLRGKYGKLYRLAA